MRLVATYESYSDCLRGIHAARKTYEGRYITPYIDDFTWANSIKFMKLLLDYIPVNAKDDYGWTPLHMAVNNKDDINFVKLLLGRGANVNEKNNIGNTPLHMAVYYSPTEVVVLLLAMGADRTIKNRKGQIPSDLAHNKELKDLLGTVNT